MLKSIITALFKRSKQIYRASNNKSNLLHNNNIHLYKIHEYNVTIFTRFFT